MGYLFGLESPILQYRGYDREDGGSTCRSISDTLLKNVDKNFQKQLQDYFLKNNTYDGVTLKHEVIDITPEGEVQIFIDSLYTRNETTKPIYNYPTNYLGKYCCEVRFMQYIVPKIESNSAVLRTGKSYFNLPAGTTAFWDDNTQTCRVKAVTTPSDSCATSFKIVLNPNGNDGTIFNVGKDDADCVLNIEFDYLFKYDCAKLGEIAMNGQEDSTSEINILRQQIAQQQVKCEAITQEIDTLNNKYANTAYSVECTNFASLLSPRTAVIPLDFDIAYDCNGSSRIGITASIPNITGGYPPYQMQATFAYTNQAAALANTSWRDYSANIFISCYLGAENWFAIRDSKGNVFVKSIFTLCSQSSTSPTSTSPTTTTTTTTTTGAGGTSTTNGTTTTTTRTPSYPEASGYVPSPYLPDWEPRIIWYNDPYTRNTTYNYTPKPYVNPISPTRIVSTNNFNNTGFGDITNISPFAFYEFGYVETKTIFCITEPQGLTEWNRILGYVNYQRFINGDPTSYTCEQVATLYKLQETNGAVYLTECTTPFGTKTSIKNQIDAKVKEQTNCNAEIARLNAQLTSLLNQPVTQTSCKTILDALETLDVSFVLDIVESDGSLTTVLEQELFPSIGSGNLYDYLLEKQDSSGFYICGSPNQEELVWADANECYTIIYRKDEFYGPSAPLGFYLNECTGRITMGDVCNVSSCRFTKDMLARGLYNQSGYDFTQIETFKASLSPKVFSSQWLKYSEVITDANILETIANKKIKISLKVNNTCSDICVMLDDIKLNKECVNGTEDAVTLTKSPGFNLTKIIDNKKAWNSNTSYVNREFVISNPTGGTSIRNTDYGVLDERLVINTKEIDLNMNIASAIENDVQCFINDYTDILNSVTEIDCGCDVLDCYENVFNIIPYAEAKASGLLDNLPWQFDVEDFLTSARAHRDAWLKAWNELMINTGPYLDVANGVPHPNPSPFVLTVLQATRDSYLKALQEFNLASGGGYIEGLTIDGVFQTPDKAQKYVYNTYSLKEKIAPQMFNTKCGRIFKRINGDGNIYFVETPTKELRVFWAFEDIEPVDKTWIELTSLVQEENAAGWDYSSSPPEKPSYFCKLMMPTNYTTWVNMMSFHYQTNNNTSRNEWVNPVEDSFFIEWDDKKGKCMTNMFKEVVPEQFSMHYPITSLNMWKNYADNSLIPGQPVPNSPQCIIDVYLRNSGSTACTSYDYSWPDTADDIDTIYRAYRDVNLKLENEVKLTERRPLYLINIIDPATNMLPDETSGVIPLKVTTTIRKGSRDGNIVYKEQYLINNPSATCNLFKPSYYGMTVLGLYIGVSDPNSYYTNPNADQDNFNDIGIGCAPYGTVLSGNTSGLPLPGASANGLDRNWRFDEDYYVHFDVVNNNTNYVYEVTNNDYNLKDRMLPIVCPTSASTQTFNINAAINRINTHKTTMLNNIQDDLDWALDNCSCDLPEPPMFTDAMALDFMDDLTRMPSFENMVAIPYTSGTVDYSSSATLYGKSNEYSNEAYLESYYKPIKYSIEDLEYAIATGMTMGFPIEAYPTLNYSGLTEPNFNPNKIGNYVKGKIRKIANLWWKKAYTYSAWTATTYVTHNKTLNELFPNVQDFKYLRAQTHISDLPIKGNPGDLIVIGYFESSSCVGCGAPSTFVGYAWDPILESWSTGLYNFIKTTILNTRTAQRDAKLKAKKEVLIATKPLVWANEYFIAHGVKQWMYGDAKNFVPGNRKGSDVIYNYNNGLPLGLPPTYVVTATTHTIPAYTGNSDNIIY